MSHTHFTRASKSAPIFDENAALGRAKRGKKGLSRKALGTIPINRQRQEGGKKDLAKKNYVEQRISTRVADDRMSLDNTGISQQSAARAHLDRVNAEDEHNPQLVTEYVDEIVEGWLACERKYMPNPDYLNRQADINARMRSILIDWLIEVHLKFKLKPETLYLTIFLIDRFLDNREVARSRLQLVGCTAMLLASKYEEIYAPEIRDFVYISDKAYTRDEILKMESIMINSLGFHLTQPYALYFAQRFLRVSEHNDRVKHMTNFLMELTLVTADFIKFTASEIACGALYIARVSSNQPAYSTRGSPHKALSDAGMPWTPTLALVSQKSEEEVLVVARAIHNLLLNPNPKEKAVRKKYSSSRFCAVAKTPIPKYI